MTAKRWKETVIIEKLPILTIFNKQKTILALPFVNSVPSVYTSIPYNDRGSSLFGSLIE